MSENQKLHAVIYSKPNCMPCKMTKKLLNENNIHIQEHYYTNINETNIVDIESTDPKKKEWSEKKIEKIKKKYAGLQSFPIVKVVNQDGLVLDVWSGFQPSKIKKAFNIK